MSFGGQFDVQEKLRSLLQQLQWSYVTLWSFNSQSRSLEWKGGHFMGDPTAQSGAQIWNSHLFKTQQTCVFSPGQGSVGRAYAEQRNIWMNGPAVGSSAGSAVQAHILKTARIQTAVYIPSAESVLEIGTSASVAEDIQLVSNVSDFMWGNTLLPLTQAQAPLDPQASQWPLATTSLPVPLLSGAPHQFLQRDFDVHSRSMDTNVFLQHPEEGEEKGTTSSEVMWGSAPSTSYSTDMMLQIPKDPFLRYHPYRSHSGTTSSSLSGLEDSPAKLVVDSPDQSVSLRASSSHRRDTASQSPEVPQDIQQAIWLMLRELEPLGGQWPQVYMDPALGTRVEPKSAFELWQHAPSVRQLRRKGMAQRGLLLRCVDLLRRPSPQLTVQVAPQLMSVEPRQTSSSSPDGLPEMDPSLQAGPSTGPTQKGWASEAARRAHMENERGRRLRQKQNFVALRKLVPIISKNDKASILSDAIVYIKVLQKQIQSLQALVTETESRCEALKLTQQELEERNRLLEAMAAGTTSGATSPGLPPP